ncbi:MAG: GlsB/YeaQ/YmgE family stress response membrane protein [Streptosporangiales bacterium]|nr:GlsB/YeaQ/YmgE family stress response membrane protein [Streptosporangiales bacterium]
MSIGGIFSAIIIGLIIGALGRLIVPGKQNFPIWLTLLVGVVAAFIGTFIARLFGVQDTRGIDWLELVFQLVVAAIGVVAVASIYRSRAST